MRCYVCMNHSEALFIVHQLSGFNFFKTTLLKSEQIF